MPEPLIDLHAHVLPAVDDGPADVEAALELARAMADGGVGIVAATSHVSDRYPNRPEGLAAARTAFAAHLRAHAIPLDVVAGAEVALAEAVRLEDATLAALRLGGGPWLLVEPPLSPAAVDVEPGVRHLLDRGHRVILAHPERSPALQRSPGQLERLVAAGVLCAVTSGALTGRFGRVAADIARHHLAEGLGHLLTSDAHDLAGRAPTLRADVEEAAVGLPGLGGLADHLCRAVPRAILDGTPLPAPPGSVELPAAPLRWRRLRPGRRRARR